jgi:hypothetical protein
MTNITSKSSNNTNTNTNSYTNNNSSKNKDTQTNKKILKNKHSVSPNSTHIYTQTSSNSKYYYKSKTNQRLNIIKKSNLNLKPSLTQIKSPKKEFSKTCNNFYIYTTNNNRYNNNKNYNINNNKFSKKKNKSKSNTKLIKEKKIVDGPNKPLSSHTSCIFSPMTPISIKRQKKYSMSHIISNTKIENDINSNIISFKREISEKNLNSNYNNSSTDLNQNSRKLILIKEMKNNISNNGLHYNNDNKNEQKYQMTEGNINYLRVRKKSDIHMNSNNNQNNMKIQPIPELITDISNIKLPSSHTSCIFNDDTKNGIIPNNRLINISEKSINSNTNNPSTEKCSNINSVLNIKNSDNNNYNSTLDNNFSDEENSFASIEKARSRFKKRNSINFIPIQFTPFQSLKIKLPNNNKNKTSRTNSSLKKKLKKRGSEISRKQKFINNIAYKNIVKSL